MVGIVLTRNFFGDNISLGDCMKISSKGRYGLQAMYYVAKLGGENYVTINQLSRLIGTSEDYLEKLMAKLKRADLVVSTRGNNGGYKLSRPAVNITIGQILRCLENGIFTSKCVDGTCTAANCPHKDIFTLIYTKINGVLDDMTLNDMLKE